MTAAQRTAWVASIGVGALALLVFARFWFDASRLPDNGPVWAWASPVLFVLLTLVIWHRIAMDALAHVLSGLVGRRPAVPAPPTGLHVAFITTFVPSVEPLSMLRATLVSMLEADYPHDTWVLDEGDDADARALCDELGVRHFSRRGVERYNQPEGRFAARTKGGNHNAWYDAHGHAYDVVAQIDTDFLVRRDFLTATLGHFADERTAWVVTPQIYGNHGENLVSAGSAQQQYTFYGPLLQGLSARGSALMLGANHVVRVSALRSVGYYEGHITEDLATGIKLHAQGWRSYYVPQPLAVGEAPTTWLAYFKQQFRWAFGCFSVLFQVTPRVLRRLGWERGLYYAWMQQNYFSGLTFVVGGALIALYFTTGVAPAAVPLLPLLAAYAPYLVWRQLHWWGMQRFHVRPDVERGWLWSGRLIGVLVQPVYALALLGAVLGRKFAFQVTPKGVGGRQVTPLAVFRPHLWVAGAMSAAGTCGLALGHTAGAMVAWMLFTVVAMTSVVLAEAPARAANAWAGLQERAVTAGRRARTVGRHAAAASTVVPAPRQALVIDLREEAPATGPSAPGAAVSTV